MIQQLVAALPPERMWQKFRPSLRMGWMDGWMDGVSKLSFNFLYTLWVYRSCISILIYIVKNVTNILIGLKI